MPSTDLPHDTNILEDRKYQFDTHVCVSHMYPYTSYHVLNTHTFPIGDAGLTPT